jgi:antitoxin component YwqK of YwqJK toxin-antitoxin module
MKNIALMIIIFVVAVSCSNDGPKEVKLEEGEKVVTSFANGTPQLVREMKEKDGKLEAVYEKEYYEDGNLLKEGAILENQRHGTWKAYYRSGKLWNVGSYDRGVRSDSIVGYYPNGNVKYRGLYTDGQKSGSWMYYDESGELAERKVFMQPGEQREEPLVVPE